MTYNMKTFAFYLSLTALLIVYGLCTYFECIPPPKASLNQRLSTLFPEEFNQWKISDQDIAESPESSARISNFLNFDDIINRIYQKVHCVSVFTLLTGHPGKHLIAGLGPTHLTPAGF